MKAYLLAGVKEKNETGASLYHFTTLCIGKLNNQIDRLTGKKLLEFPIIRQ